MSKFDRNRIKGGWEKLCTNRQTDRHYENNGHLSVNQKSSLSHRLSICRMTVYAASGVKKKQLPTERLLKSRWTFSRSVMVSVAVSSLGCTDLFFVDPGIKVDGQYYRNVLLRQQLLCQLFVFRGLSGDLFTFQQDNAPAHRARKTVQCAVVSWWNFRLHCSSSVACQQSWPESGRLPYLGETAGACLPQLSATGFMMWISWSHVWSKSGKNSSNRSLMKRTSSGVSVFEPAFKHAEDISNINFRHAYCLIFFQWHIYYKSYMAVDTSFFECSN